MSPDRGIEFRLACGIGLNSNSPSRSRQVADRVERIIDAEETLIREVSNALYSPYTSVYYNTRQSLLNAEYQMFRISQLLARRRRVKR